MAASNPQMITKMSDIVYDAYYSPSYEKKYGSSYKYVIRETGKENVVTELRMRGKKYGPLKFSDSKLLGTVTSECLRGRVWP